jgi:sensor histidine kinase YesM
MSDDKLRCRQTLMVNKPFQNRMIREACLIPLLSLLVGMLITMTCFYLTIQDAMVAGVKLVGIANCIACMIGFIFLACFVTIGLSVRLSNRIAGPLYRLEKSMEQLQKGDTNCRIKLRDGDYLIETVDIFNHMLDHLEKTNPDFSASMRKRKMRERALETAAGPKY